MKRKTMLRLLVPVLFLALVLAQEGISVTASYNPYVGTHSEIITLTEGTNIAVSISPDHSKIVMDLQGVLWTLPLTGGIAKRITDNFADPALPDWSPDGKRIVFQSYKGGNFHIWTMRPDGSDMRQLTFGPYDDREPSFSPDGTRIAFSSDRGGSYDIWVLELQTGNLTRWTKTPKEEYQPTWSPDGKEIAFLGETNAKQVVAIDASGNRRILVTEDEGTISSPSWSPDGKDIAYILQKGGQSHLMVSGKQITHSEDVFPFPVQWLSSNKIFYTADGHIKARNLDQKSSETIPFRVQITLKEIAYTNKKHDFDSRKPRPVKGIVSPTLSPNQKQVAFVALNDLWLMETANGITRALTHDPYMELDPTWSPDGKKLAYSSDKAGTEDIYILHLESGVEQRLTSLPAAEVASAWSPDGNQIAYQDQNGATYTVDVNTGEGKQVIEPLNLPGPPTWGPDGKTIGLSAIKTYSGRFREGTNQILIVNLATGSKNYVEPLSFQVLE